MILPFAIDTTAVVVFLQLPHELFDAARADGAGDYVDTVSGRAANPLGAILAGAVVLAAPAVIVFVALQKRFVNTNLGSGVKG